MVEILHQQKDLIVEERLSLLHYIGDEDWLICEWDPSVDELLFREKEGNIFEGNAAGRFTMDTVREREKNSPGTCWACGRHADAKDCTFLYWSELVRRKKYPHKRGVLKKLGYFKYE